MIDLLEAIMTESFLYGSATVDQYMLHNPDSLPRYGHLARKVMVHYAGECYNTHEHGLWHEPFLRQMIRDMVSYKVFHRLPDYDWEFIDNMFRRYIAKCFNISLPYNQKRIDQGFSIHQTPTSSSQSGTVH